MTPIEKAIELVEKYKPYMYCYMGSGMLSNEYDADVAREYAKTCVKIAVDELLHELKEIEGTFDEETRRSHKGELYKSVPYWEEVKTEIDNIEN